MSRDNKTIARPYAKAVFEFAKDHKTLSEWHSMLQLLADVVHENDLSRLLVDPNVSYDDVGKALLSCLKGHIDEYGQNFVALLSQNRRLENIVDILKAFETKMREDEREIDATLISAFPAEEAFVKKLSLALQDKLNKTVILTTKVDKTLLGGAMVRINDWVVDGSLKGKLSNLMHRLVN